MTFPDHIPTWMTEPAVPPMPAWCRGAGEKDYTSHIPATGASTRTLASPTVKVGKDSSVHLFSDEQVLDGQVTHTPVTVRLWGYDGDLPIDLTADEAQELGLALVEHAVRLRVIEEAQGH